MKEYLKLLALAPLSIGLVSCSTAEQMIYHINESTAAIHENREAVQASTEMIMENRDAVQQSTEVIKENHRVLEKVKNS